MGEGEGGQPWASCGPRRHSLCLPDHAVYWFLRRGPLVGNCVLRILTLVVDYYRAVVKLFPGGALQRERPETQGEVREAHPSLGWGDTQGALGRLSREHRSLPHCPGLFLP